VRITPPEKELLVDGFVAVLPGLQLDFAAFRHFERQIRNHAASFQDVALRSRPTRHELVFDDPPSS
jgi:hypothetical protein